MSRTLLAMMLLLTLALLPACGDGHDHDHDGDMHLDAFGTVSKAVCVLSPTTGTELTGVSGVVTLIQTKDGLLVEAELTGLKPDSKHGFHIHEWGNVSDPVAATAAGGHYNPGNAKHGLPGEGHMHGDVEVHMTGGHAGALGNLEADSEGKATFSKTFENISLTGLNAVLGRSFVVHLEEDEGTEDQPFGGAGPAVAQGVIGIADPEAE